MVERYIEGSGVAWAHLHPRFFMDNLLVSASVIGGKLYWFIGEQPVGWIAPEDIGTVAARVLADGPDQHGGKQYLLAAQMLNGTQAAAEIAKGLDTPVEAVVLTPDYLLAQVASGGTKMPAYVEATYGASILEWIRQTYEGRLNFVKVTSVVEDLTGNKPLTLETWVRANHEAVSQRLHNEVSCPP
jgi:NAD(P)H dehydrogenase (quinone)